MNLLSYQQSKYPSKYLFNITNRYIKVFFFFNARCSVQPCLIKSLRVPYSHVTSGYNDVIKPIVNYKKYCKGLQNLGPVIRVLFSYSILDAEHGTDGYIILTKS